MRWSLLLAPLIIGGCNASGETPMRLLLPGMALSIPYNGYDPHPVVGKASMLPPDGSVPYAQGYFPLGPLDPEAAAAAVNPFAGVDAELPRGKRIYDRFCLVCHGQVGAGDGPIIGRFPNPPSLLAPKAKAMPDGQMFHVMTNGRGLMASYAVQVSPEDRWRLVAYIRWLQRTGGEP